MSILDRGRVPRRSYNADYLAGRPDQRGAAGAARPRAAHRHRLRPRRYRPVGRGDRLAHRHRLRVSPTASPSFRCPWPSSSRSCAGAACGRGQRHPRRLHRLPRAHRDARDVLRVPSLALVVSGQRPIDTRRHPGLLLAARAIELPLIGGALPLVPLGVFTFLIPAVIVVWIAMNKTTWGRAHLRHRHQRHRRDLGGHRHPSAPGQRLRLSPASSLGSSPSTPSRSSPQPGRTPGPAGNGMALPAITIAVLGGVAITGGIGRSPASCSPRC